MLTNTLHRTKVEQMLSRAQHLQLFGTTADGRPLGQALTENFQTMLATDDEARVRAAAFGRLVQKAHEGDLDSRQQLHALVIETVTNYVVATMNFGRFFEVRTLADNESPAVQNNTRQEIRAGFIAQDGSPTRSKVIRPQHETQIDLRQLVSDEVTYRLRDLYSGDVTDAARATFDIAFDLKHQLEANLYSLLTATPGNGGALGAFDTTHSNRARRTYNAHSRIAAGVLPTTNVLTMTGTDGTSKFGFPALDEVVDYCVRFAGTDPSGDLRPTGELIVPAQDVREIAAGITPTGAKPTDMAESLIRDGWVAIGSYLGVNWRVVPDNTIPRKALFAVMNQPVGILWTKPGMSEVEEKVEKIKNQASRIESMVYGAAIPGPRCRHIVKVTYRT